MMYEKNLKFLFTDLDTGTVFQIGHGLWEIETIKGLFQPSYTVYTSDKATGHGLKVTGKQMKGREITVTASVVDTRKNDTARLEANRFFNPLHSFRVDITYYNTTRWGECELTGVDCPQTDMDAPTQLKVMIICPSAFLKGTDNFGKDLAEIVPAFTFPYISTVDDGFNFGFYNFANKATVINEGDVETQCKVIFSARGPCKNPKIIKNDREFVRVLKDMDLGDEIVVDFETGRVTFNGERITAIDRSSSFFYLDRGKNVLQAEADENLANLSTVIYYNSEFLGV